MRDIRRTALAALLAASLLSACGAEPTAAPPVPVPPTTVVDGGADGNGDAVPDLPDLSTIPEPTAPAKPSAPPAPVRTFGADISWPQCPKGLGIPQKRSQGSPMPTAAAEFVVIGLTNGPSFYPNPCLADQVAWVAQRHLLAAAYAVVSYPDAGTLRRYGGKGDRLQRLRNVGRAAALFNLRTMKAAGLRSPIIWVDVEPVPDFGWSDDLAANAAVVEGTARGYADAGFDVGYYSTPSLWQRVVGGLRTNAPEWRAAGQTSLAEALSRCGPDWSFGGGSGVLGQWVEDGRDRNVTCPGAITSLTEWFHRY